MQYIVQKPFSFAGDSYKAGDVFDPAKYPFVCTSAKLARLVGTRRVMEDFKVCGRDTKKPVAPVEEATEEAKTLKRSKVAE